jgi:hypothetical protein
MHSRTISVVFASALVSACTPSVIRDQSTSLFSPVEYSTQASRGDIPVLVLGSAAGLDGARLSDAVVERMQGADWPPRARFAPASMAGDRGTYSYVMLFNGPRDLTSSKLCAERSTVANAPTARTDGGIVLVAGICRYDKVASGVTARTVNVTGPNDPQFQALIVSAVQELTRVQGRQHDNSSDGKGDKS